MIIHQVTQGTPEWYHLRAGRITGTRFATLLMGKTTKGYNDLIGELTAEAITGEDLGEIKHQSPEMEWGIEMEPYARDLFSDLIYPVVEVGFITPDPGHQWEDWIGISPDGLLHTGSRYSGINAGIEIKCPLAKTHFRYLAANEVPKEYIHQVQGSLFTTGLDLWYFMSWYPKMKPMILEVTPDQELHERYQVELEVVTQAVKDNIERYKNYGYEG